MAVVFPLLFVAPRLNLYLAMVCFLLFLKAQVTIRQT